MMTKGYVYILTNPSMPGLLKIGKTTRSVEQRCEELWQTGVPTPFEIHFDVAVPDCHAAELFVHQELRDARVSASREFFRIDEKAARIALMTAQISQVVAVVDEYMPGCVVADAQMLLLPDRVDHLCSKTGESKDLITLAMSCVRPEELAPAIARIKASEALEAQPSVANDG